MLIDVFFCGDGVYCVCVCLENMGFLFIFSLEYGVMIGVVLLVSVFIVTIGGLMILEGVIV